MQEKYFKALEQLAELAGDYGNNTYSVINFALGAIVYKNSENKASEVGYDFASVARWLISEGEANWKEYENERTCKN